MKATTTTLVLGGSGQTGRRLVEQLLEQNQKVKVIVRSKERFMSSIPSKLRSSANLMVAEDSVLDMSNQDFLQQVEGCDAIVSCLGHTLDMKGIYGKPRMLCTDAIKRSYQAIDTLSQRRKNQGKDNNKPIKLILMSSNGVMNPNGLDDVRPLSERLLLCLIRALIPPHRDNEAAAAFVYETIKHDNKNVNFVAVRPDDLIDGNVSQYNLFDKPQKGLFGGGTATRANVAHFMCDLIIKPEMWAKWNNKFPVIMNIPETK